jgi:diguanylate cyclase (GGDEF)-like protein
MDDKETLAIAHQVLEYVERLQNAAEVPEIPAPFADDANFLNYHKKAIELRNLIAAFAKGDLSVPVTTKGFIASACKALQANLRHMIWKVQQIEHGDYTQRIDFLGDFSISFNSMVMKLAAAREALQQKEEALTALAVSLQQEARRRSAALQELKKSEQRFKRLAQRDPLTDLLNRRSFFSVAAMGLQSSFTLKEPCCVCMLDVDYFKRFNDTFGHLEGDRALQHVVQHSLSKLRQSDIMGRYGGEEFVFLFSSMGAEQSYAAADRIRSTIEKSAFSLENGNTTSLTVSIGVAAVLPDEKTQDYAEMLRLGITQADTALYAAKAQGRNRVCLAQSVAPTVRSAGSSNTVIAS